MHFDMATSIVNGNQPVAGQGPNAEFQSEGFRIEDRGMRVFLTGQARVVIYHQPDDGALGLPDIPTSAPRPEANPPAAPAAPNTPAARRRDLP
jgi:hypothetical protein